MIYTHPDEVAPVETMMSKMVSMLEELRAVTAERNELIRQVDLRNDTIDELRGVVAERTRQLAEVTLKMRQLEAKAHTDHPSRHWDRTCPACLREELCGVPDVMRGAAPCDHVFITTYGGSFCVKCNEPSDAAPK